MAKRGWNPTSVLLILGLLLIFSHTINPLSISHSQDESSSSMPFQIDEQILSDSSPLPPIWNHTTPDEAWIRPVALSMDGTTLVEGAMEMVTILNQTDGTVIWEYNTSSIVMDVAVSNNGSWIVAGTSGNDTLLFNIASNEPVWVSKCNHYIPAVDISGDGGTLIAGDWVGRVYVFDSSDNQSLYEYDTGDRITEVCTSYNGSRIAVGGLHKAIYTFSRGSITPLWSYDTNDYVISVAVSENGTEIAGAGSAGVFVFGPNSNETLWTYDLPGFQCVDVSDDGTTIAAGRSNINDVNLFLWDASSNESLWTFNNTNQVRSVTLSSDGSQLAAGSYDNRTYLFERTSNETIFSYLSPGTVVSSDMSADGMKVISSCSKGITHFFRIDPPERPTIASSRHYYNASEVVNVTVNVSRGSFPLSYCNMSYIHEDASLISKLLVNTTPLENAVVSFSGSIGPFPEGNLQFYAIVTDIHGYTNRGSVDQKIIDGTGPTIGLIEYSPIFPTSQSDVSVSADITDAVSGLQSAILYYSSDNASTWTSLPSSSNDGTSYNFTIPSMANGTAVLFYFHATDQVGNIAIEDNDGEYYEYFVQDPIEPTTAPTNTVPETPMDPLVIVGGVAAIIVISIIGIYYFRSRKKRVFSDPPVITTETEVDGDDSTENSLALEETSNEE